MPDTISISASRPGRSAGVRPGALWPGVGRADHHVRTLKARAAFRDVARTLRVEMGDVERLTKLIPSGPAYSVTLAEASEKVPR